MQTKQQTEKASFQQKPFIKRMIFLLACIALLQGADTLVREGMQYQAESRRYEQVAQSYVQSDDCGAALAANSTAQDALLAVDFAKLQSRYPGVAAWLTLDHTEISYPVMQAEDNNYYLTHYIDGTSSKSGALFLDCRCASDDPYWVIYGHNMKDRSMFGSLREFQQASYFAQTGGGLTLYTPAYIWRYQIFAVRVVSPTDETFLPRSAQDADYAAFLKRVQSHALYDTGVPVNGNDAVLVLSTCTGKDGAQRLVLYARRVEEREK